MIDNGGEGEWELTCMAEMPAAVAVVARWASQSWSACSAIGGGTSAVDVDMNGVRESIDKKGIEGEVSTVTMEKEGKHVVHEGNGMLIPNGG